MSDTATQDRREPEMPPRFAGAIRALKRKRKALKYVPQPLNDRAWEDLGKALVAYGRVLKELGTKPDRVHFRKVQREYHAMVCAELDWREVDMASPLPGLSEDSYWADAIYSIDHALTMALDPEEAQRIAARRREHPAPDRRWRRR